MFSCGLTDRTRKNIFRSVLRFERDEDGSLIVFSLFIFIVMLMFGGIAVDLMLYENKRTHIQNSTDRAVLAAANLNQTVDPKTVVQDYLAKVGVVVSRDDVDVVEIGTAPVITGRQVAVDVNAYFDTLLMKLVGVETLPYSAASEAEEAVNDIEVSLILDVSGSMGSGSKLSNMQNAAKDFVDGILAGADDDRVSVSLVPYSTQVSVGPYLINSLTTEHDHNFSHCVNFESADYHTTAIQRMEQRFFSNGLPVIDSSGLPIFDPVPLSQTAHFDPWRSYGSSRSLYYPVCRNASYVDILPWSNNTTALKNQIDDLTANGNTSIDVAMKWGTALLDPSMNDALNDMIDNPNVEVDSAFSARPHAYNDDDSLKFVVLMTDGINTTQYRLKDAYKEGMSDIYWMNNDHWLRVGNSYWNMDDRCWHYQNKSSSTCNGNRTPSSSDRLTNLEMWSQMSMKWRAYHGWYRRTGRSSDYYDQLYDPRTEWNDSTKDAQLDDICDAAKDQGVVVFTIGFEVTDDSADVMRSCASTPNHFYRVEGLDIEVAFASIKNQINQLKLTQ